jgi:hypothetical protein
MAIASTARIDSSTFLPLLLLHAKQGWLHMKSSNWRWVRHVLWVLAFILTAVLVYSGRWDRWPLLGVPVAVGLQIWWRSFASVSMRMYVNRAVGFAPHTRTRLRWAVLLVGLCIGTLLPLLLIQWGLGFGLLLLFSMCDLAGTLLDRSGRLNRAIPFMGAMVFMQGVLYLFGAPVLKSAPLQLGCAVAALALLAWSVWSALPPDRGGIERVRAQLGKAKTEHGVNLSWLAWGKASDNNASPAYEVPRSAVGLMLHVLGPAAKPRALTASGSWTVVGMVVAALLSRNQAGEALAAIMLASAGTALFMLNGVYSARLMERMIGTGSEQTVLSLAPGIPQGAAQSRTLMLGMFTCWLRNALLLGGVALLCLAAMGGLGQGGKIAAAFSFMVYNLPALLGDWSRRFSIGEVKLTDVLGLLQPIGLLAGFLYLSSLGWPMQWWWLAVFNVAYAAALFGVNWMLAMGRPPAWPCGSRAK